LSGIVLWLIPDGSRESFFSNAIQRFSAATNAPVFIPHITAGRIPDHKCSRVSPILAEIAEQSTPFRLHTKDLECRNHPYQKLVITLSPHKKFQSLCTKIDNVLGGNFSKSEDPHISLLYSHQDCNQIHDSGEKTGGKIPRVVKINEIAAVELRGRPETWKVLGRKKFHAAQ
jgi:2'-5' RNA ligase